MVEIQNTLVSLDIFSEFFCCDLTKCHGACCVEGDAGAPVTMDEVALLEEAAEVVWNDLAPEAKAEIEQNGVVYPDRDGELVTSIVNNKDCVFTCYGNLAPADAKGKGPRCCFCAIDKACREGRFHWAKPISCALYPIRVSVIGGAPALNYHRWDVCRPARELGRQQGIRVYEFLREPLIRRFGEEWYEECCVVARELKAAGYI